VSDKYECRKCFDTGCQCGGIGLSCHGCCDCEAGEESRDNRKRALMEVVCLTGRKLTREDILIAEAQVEL